MATFSDRYARAVHVLPLHALKNIFKDGALLSKDKLVQRTAAATRRTTSRTDEILGLTEYVHFYLLRQDISWESIPILATQLLARDDPFPHVALETSTGDLRDDECTLCLWNIAVSRPAVERICKGGNWTRGTNPHRIKEIWQAFRDVNPDLERARGYWNDPIKVPTLRGAQIVESLPLLKRAPGGIPELLLKAPIQVQGRFTLWVFSEEDMASITPLQPLFDGVDLRKQKLQGYQSTSPTTQTWRSHIEPYFRGLGAFPAGLDFDRRRSV